MDDLTRLEDGELGDVENARRAADDERMLTTAFICGRGRVGKTVVANTYVQFCRQRGARLEAWNSDRQNETHTLSLFHADASRPATDGASEKGFWFEANLDRQARERFDAVLDMAGGDPMVRHLARDVRLVETMKRRGLRAVAWHVLGPEAADLDYLKLSMKSELFAPAATLVVVNTGVLVSGRSAELAFAEVCSHRVVVEALDRGAKLIRFPALECMSAIIDQGLTFAEAVRGVTKPGCQPMTFLDQARVEIFWKDHIPSFFAEIPLEWLPAMVGHGPSIHEGGLQ
jgi:hypothetical protein